MGPAPCAPPQKRVDGCGQVALEATGSCLARAISESGALVWTGQGEDLRYAQRVAGRFDEYLRMRAYFYAQETRWADAPFWARRHEHVVVLP